MVLDNLGPALRVSLLLYIVSSAPQLFLYANPPAVDAQGLPMMEPGAASLIFVLGLVAICSSLWIAVAWHRYVLTGELSGGWVPAWHGPEVLRYLGYSLLLGLIVVVAAFLAAIPAAIVMMVLSPLAPIALLGIAVACLYVALRLGTALPGIAMGQKMNLQQGWSETAGHNKTIVVLAVIVAGVGLLVQVPTLMNADPASVLNLVYGLVVGWFATMIGVSVLTTLYGVCVEGRHID
ncbi:hypothetical protein [Pseudoponticoccus marisrubri]|nr:hypothetical protein [Pseudoponticoccus marisrubri]